MVRKEIGSFTWDFLESIFVSNLVTSQYMTRRIIEEIKFYEILKPFDILREGVFGSGCGLEDEHLILINLNFSHDGLVYQDSFEWDLVSENV